MFVALRMIEITLKKHPDFPVEPVETRLLSKARFFMRVFCEILD